MSYIACNRAAATGRTRKAGRGIGAVLRGLAALATAAFLLVPDLPGQQPTQTGDPADQAPGGAASRPAAFDHIRVDGDKKQVVVDAQVSLREGALEFALSSPAKGYESLMTTDVPPSMVHAALLALGLTPGKPAQWTAAANGEQVFAPPKGAMLEIAVRWKGDDHKTRQAPITDWMLSAAPAKKAGPTRWVFVGSDFLDDGRYWADAEGHLISVANFASSVIDVPFESSEKDALREFAANPTAMPPAGTPVEVVITPVKGAENAPDARIQFEVDGFGQIRMEGDPIAPDRIAPAVKEFLSRHSKGSAQVRIDPRALVYDRDRLSYILQDAGMTDVAFETRSLRDEVLPRTAVQAEEALAWWKGQFARAKDLIVDPGEDAAATIEHIQRRRRQLERLSELWGDYAAGLQGLIEQRRKTTADRQESQP